MFFSSFCSEAGKLVLVSPDRVVDLRDGAQGFELHFHCYCGRPGVLYPKREKVGRCTERCASAQIA